MNMDRATLELLRHQHPACQLLCASHAPLVVSFLHEVFVEPNVRSVSQAELGEALEDRLYLLREDGDVESFPRHGLEYLNDWAQSEAGCASSTRRDRMSRTSSSRRRRRRRSRGSRSYVAILWFMADHERHTIRIDRHGHALIPKPMREAMGLVDGGEAIAWLEGKRLVIEPREALLRQLNARFACVEGSMSEELIRERRGEAHREGAV